MFPKKQTKGTKSADFCSDKGGGGKKIRKYCGRHISMALKDYVDGVKKFGNVADYLVINVSRFVLQQIPLE